VFVVFRERSSKRVNGRLKCPTMLWSRREMRLCVRRKRFLRGEAELEAAKNAQHKNKLADSQELQRVSKLRQKVSRISAHSDMLAASVSGDRITCAKL